jgi:ubiquinone/menaquinone biosynthesis C-methylase UbiE
MSYLETTHRVYREAAAVVQKSLCCTAGPRFRLPGLTVPAAMEEMNYGCGSTVDPRDVTASSDVLYIGVGSGLEALQFAWFTRRPRSVIAVDRVPEMLDVARRNLAEAERLNPWFRSEQVELLHGDALRIPLPDQRVDVVAQNCLFNIFTPEHLDQALAEAARVLKPGGRLVLSDPICEQPMPDRLRADERLRAECLSGAQTLEDYLAHIVSAGFGTIEIRSRRPYRVLDRRRFGVEQALLLESIEAVAIKGPVPADGPCIFAGETVIYVGEAESYDDGRGHLVQRDIPLAVCRKTAAAFRALAREDLVVSAPTWHYSGGGCC